MDASSSLRHRVSYILPYFFFSVNALRPKALRIFGERQGAPRICAALFIKR
jgi:hypothetical protein